MLGTALYEAGAAEAAETQYRLVLDRQPHSGQARIALAEVLLYQRRYAEAAAEAARLPAASRWPRAARGPSCSAGSPPATSTARRGARERARRRHSPDELALFAGWAALAAGGHPTRALPVPAIALLGTILEALLRVHEFNLRAARRRSVGVRAAEREQRELLAGMYLRRGFVASAAEEWLAVCKPAPDVRALIGLARVAERQGMPEDAVVFASEALALEPGNAIARTLADAVPLAA